MLFVGGPLHGQGIEVQPVEQTALEIATNQPKRLPPTYVDLASAHQYRLAPWQHAVTDPAGALVAEYVMPVYMSLEQNGQPLPQVQATVWDAVVTAFFREFGRLKDRQVAAVAASNGHVPAELALVYVAVCEVCGPLDGSPFDTLLGRAAAMSKHIDATGHKVGWSDEPSTSDDTKGQ